MLSRKRRIHKHKVILFQREIRREVTLEVLAQITPVRVHGLDQTDLLFAPPTLNLLLASDGGNHIGERFILHQARKTVVLGKASGELVLELENAPGEVARHNGVERMRRIAHCIYVVILHTSTPFTGRIRLMNLAQSVSFRAQRGTCGSVRQSTRRFLAALGMTRVEVGISGNLHLWLGRNLCEVIQVLPSPLTILAAPWYLASSAGFGR